jgi:hypothetical protein
MIAHAKGRGPVGPRPDLTPDLEIAGAPWRKPATALHSCPFLKAHPKPGVATELVEMHLNGGRGSIVVLDNLELPEHGFQIGLNHSSPTAPHIPSYPPKSLWLLETRIPRPVLRRSLRGFPRSDRPGRTPSVLDRGYAGTSENACCTSLVNKGIRRRPAAVGRPNLRGAGGL